MDLESSSVVATPQPEWMIAGTTGGLVSTDDGITVRWYDPDCLGDLQVAEGAAAGRNYDTGDRIDWLEETIPVEPVSGQQTVLYYQKLAETLRGGAELFVTPQSVRRQIDIIERARAQTGLI